MMSGERMSLPRIRFGLLFALAGSLGALVSLAASAEIYEWTEEDGVVHYADGLTQVPDQYRDSVRITETVSPEPPQAAAAPQQAAAPPPAAASPAEKQPSEEMSEAQWRAEATRLDALIAKLAPEAKRCETDHINLSPGDGSRKRGEEYAEAKACAETGEALVRAHTDREALTERARQADVPPGWLRGE